MPHVHYPAECAICDGITVIMASWVLRSSQSSCTDMWKSVMIGQDIFTRHEQTDGPRRHLGTHVPEDAEVGVKVCHNPICAQWLLRINPVGCG